jgi:hypothetical protein
MANPRKGIRQPGKQDLENEIAEGMEGEGLPVNPNGARETAEEKGESVTAIPAESVVVTELVSSEVNRDVTKLVEGLIGLKKFYTSEDNQEPFEEFFENNRQTIEELLKTDIKATYDSLEKNGASRNQFYKTLLEDKVISPEEKDQLLGIVSNGPFMQLVGELGTRSENRQTLLTRDEQDNLSNATLETLPGLLQELQTANKITAEEGRRLTALGPKTDRQIKEARDRVLARIKSYDLGGRTSHADQYQKLNQTEENLMEKFEEYRKNYNIVVKKLVEEIQSKFDRMEEGKYKDYKIRELTKATGLPIKKGQILWARDSVNGRPGPDRNTRLEIKDITFGEIEKDSSLAPEFQVIKPSFEPYVIFTTQAGEGAAPEEYKLSASSFDKWLKDNQVTEKFETTEALEETLGIKDTLKEGQSFSYLDADKAGRKPLEHGEAPGNNKEDFNTVTIVKIENGKIYLDHPVRINTNMNRGRGQGSVSTAELDFGEFALWYRKFVVVPEAIDLDKLDQLLEQHHHQLLAEMGWPEDHGAPINLSDGGFPLHLIPAYYGNQLPPIVVSGVKDGLIEMGSGDKMTPSEFYRFVKENGFTRPTAEQLKELQTEAAGKQDKAQMAKLDAAAASKNLAPDSPSAKTSGGESAKPHAGTGFWPRLKEFWGNTNILSLMEAYNLFWKAPVERVKEWMKDKSERRQYAVGKEFYKGFPDFGGLSDLSKSYEDKLTGKFAEDVKKTEEFFDKNYTSKQVQEALYAAPNKAVLRAGIQFLSKRGLLRWEDDKRLWAIMNVHLKGFTYPEKFHHELGRNYIAIAGDNSPKTLAPNLDIYDQCRALIDGQWGTGTYDSINGTNEREYQNKKKETQDKIHQEYEYRGGIGNALKKMLYDWEQGVDVKQAEFDGLLSQATLLTEIPPEQAVFILISAFAIKNKNGQTIIGNSRLNSYIPYLSKHQMFFYFALNHPALDEQGRPLMEADGVTPKKKKFDWNRFSNVYENVMKKDIESSGKSDFNKFTAGKNTLNWMAKDILTSKLVKDKMQEKAGNQDIDIMYYHLLGPLIKQENLDKVIGKSFQSLQKPEALKNMYAGYNYQLAIKASQLNTGDTEEDRSTRAEEFSDMVYGFIYFNNVLQDRIQKGGAHMRMDRTMFASRPLADKKRTTLEFCNEVEQFMTSFIGGVAVMAGDEKLALMHKSIVENPSRMTDQMEAEYRTLLREDMVKLAKEKPQDFARLAQGCAGYMKGLSGAQLTAAEIKSLKEGA